MFGGDQFIRFSSYKKMQRIQVKNSDLRFYRGQHSGKCYISGSVFYNRPSQIEKFKESFIMKLNLLLLSIYDIYYMLHSATQIMQPRARKLEDVCAMPKEIVCDGNIYL